MTLYVFGAGATRGCKFVDPTASPCLPPLDADFFTQLQRVGAPKHQDLVRSVMNDVVSVFGLNFDASLETVFTTLEHTIRMLRTTGDNRDFKRAELEEKRTRLRQAIAVVFEEALTGPDSSREPKACEHHCRFVADVLRPEDCIVTFNYDCVLDFSLKSCGSEKWNPRYGYGFNLGAGGKNLRGDEFWRPEAPAKRGKSCQLLKLHGSLHFDVGKDERVKFKQRPYTKQQGNLHFTIIPPEWHKDYDQGVFPRLWKLAADGLQRTQEIIMIGYSLPPTDLHATALFRTAVKRSKLQSLVVVNPDPVARRRIRDVLSRGLSADTRVVSYNYFEEFLAAPRQSWAAS